MEGKASATDLSLFCAQAYHETHEGKTLVDHRGNSRPSAHGVTRAITVAHPATVQFRAKRRWALPIVRWP
jgi:hypothetical protein